MYIYKSFRICKKCGKGFFPGSSVSKFCSQCRMFKCKNCGKEYKAWPGKITNFCSKKCQDNYRRGRRYGKRPVISKEELHRRKLAAHDLWATRKEELIQKIRASMARPEVKAKLSLLNKRERSPMSDEHKAKISDRLVGKFPANFQEFCQENSRGSKHGWIEIGGKKFYMRSTWERNYARYIQWLKEAGEIKDWDYECHRFVFEKIKFGTRTYLPDFKIIENDGSYYWVEVKGRLMQRGRTQLKRMLKYFPEEKVLVLDEAQYKALRHDLKNLIPGWERDVNLRRIKFEKILSSGTKA